MLIGDQLENFKLAMGISMLKDKLIFKILPRNDREWRVEFSASSVGIDINGTKILQCDALAR